MRAATPARSNWSAPRGAFPHPQRTARPDGLAAVYRRRNPTATPLYPIVQQHLEFLAALSRLIPPPRVHRDRYHGVLAPNATLRQRVVSLSRGHDEPSIDPATSGTPPNAAGATEVEPSAPDLPDSPQRTAARSRWARLIARIYEVFPLLCPACGADMRILAFITAAEGEGRRGSRQPEVAEDGIDGLRRSPARGR